MRLSSQTIFRAYTLGSSFICGTLFGYENSSRNTSDLKNDSYYQMTSIIPGIISGPLIFVPLMSIRFLNLFNGNNVQNKLVNKII